LRWCEDLVIVAADATHAARGGYHPCAAATAAADGSEGGGGRVHRAEGGVWVPSRSLRRTPGEPAWAQVYATLLNGRLYLPSTGGVSAPDDHYDSPATDGPIIPSSGGGGGRQGRGHGLLLRAEVALAEVAALLHGRAHAAGPLLDAALDKLRRKLL
jgi:hypothetical protein